MKSNKRIVLYNSYNWSTAYTLYLAAQSTLRCVESKRSWNQIFGQTVNVTEIYQRNVIFQLTLKVLFNAWLREKAGFDNLKKVAFSDKS